MPNHIHKYQRSNIGKKAPHYVMKCVLPECSHYVHMNTKLSVPILRDCVALCNRCDTQFVLNKRALRMAEPCCDNCVNRRKSLAEKKAESFWEELENGLKE